MAKNLLFDCHYSDVWVHPENWKSLTTQKSLKLNWYVECKFYDPLFKEKYPKGFPYRKKVNKFRTLEERKAAIQLLLKEIPKLLEDKHYNPITKVFMVKEVKSEIPDTLSPNLDVMKAFRLAHTKIKASEKHRDQIRFALNRFEKALKELRMDEIKIKDFKRGDLRSVLDYLNLTDNYYNKFRAYLSSLFCELLEYDCCEYNIARDLRKRKIVKNIREVLDDNTFMQIRSYLRANQYEFYNYLMIFFFSGSRSSELLRLKKKDIDLQNQEYKMIIEKGKQYTETIKVIIPSAIPFWKHALKNAKMNDYIFGKNLLPSEENINPNAITRRWKYHVKNKLVIKDGVVIEKSTLKKSDTDYKEITADFYAFKHLFLDKIDTMYNEEFSSTLGGHTSTNITKKVYLVGKKKRENEVLKNITFDLWNGTK